MMVRALAFVILAFASPALAGVDFQPYEGKPVTYDGQGGTKIAKHGIDFWTSGEPPRKYQVIGLVIDVRKSGRLRGKTIGSETIAKKVLAAGGDAVILMDARSQNVGSFATGQAYGTGNSIFGSASSFAITENTSRLIAVKYLP